MEVDAETSDGDSVATLARFYLGCIEAEQAAGFAVSVAGDYVEVDAGFVEEGIAVPIPEDTDTIKWCRKRLRDDPDGVVSHGWPVCVGLEPRSRELSLSPLLVGDVRVFAGPDGRWGCERAGGGVDLNVSALGLLGISVEDRRGIESAVARSVAVDEAKGRRERAAALLRELVELGVEGLEESSNRRRAVWTAAGRARWRMRRSSCRGCRTAR